MEDILNRIPNVSIYLDDILVTGTTEQEHLETLDKVLTSLETAGLRLKAKKCAFMLPSVEYLGHKISNEGLQLSVVLWPRLDAYIKSKVQNCQLNQKTPTLAPLHPWEWPKHLWTRLYIDHAGPFLGKLFLVIVDAHSKWLEVRVASTLSAASLPSEYLGLSSQHTGYRKPSCQIMALHLQAQNFKNLSR